MGGLAVTGSFNVPLNNKLAKVEPESEEGRAVPVWLVWNHVRTVACCAASVSLVAELLRM
ncbi:anthrone oxygenase family protein [Paenibacillus sp. CAU 1782]